MGSTTGKRGRTFKPWEPPKTINLLATRKIKTVATTKGGTMAQHISAGGRKGSRGSYPDDDYPYPDIVASSTIRTTPEIKTTERTTERTTESTSESTTPTSTGTTVEERMGEKPEELFEGHTIGIRHNYGYGPPNHDGKHKVLAISLIVLVIVLAILVAIAIVILIRKRKKDKANAGKPKTSDAQTKTES